MPETPRVLPTTPFRTLDDYLAAGGGRGLDIARKLGPVAVIDEVEASGLRGRGGAGFPTGKKWRTVAGLAAADLPTTIVVNGAEGEPGTFKDRAILRSNPHAVLEGALIAALAVAADTVVVALKETFTTERARIERAIAEIDAAGWLDGVTIGIATGPSSYLFGEETALLEVLDGRPPFPRVAPPYLRGVDEVGTSPGTAGGTDLARRGAGGAPPTLANNVETMANVAPLLAEGADWFRSLGTAASPGTVVCTISGSTARHGVAELPLGTPLLEVLERIGGGAEPGHQLVAAMSGVANALIPADLFGTPVTYEDLNRIGSGLGAAGFLVFDDGVDLASVAAGVSRFLSVESCGQCTPCKQDGLAISNHLARIVGGEGNDYDLVGVVDLVATVADEARCFLAQQHQRVLESIIRLFPAALRRHIELDVPTVTPYPIVPILDIGDDGRFTLDEAQLGKQPDWTYDEPDSGKTPAERLARSAS